MKKQTSWVGEQLTGVASYEQSAGSAGSFLVPCAWALDKDSTTNKWVSSYKMKQAALEQSQFSRMA